MLTEQALKRENTHSIQPLVMQKQGKLTGLFFFMAFTSVYFIGFSIKVWIRRNFDIPAILNETHFAPTAKNANLYLSL